MEGGVEGWVGGVGGRQKTVLEQLKKIQNFKNLF